jgi:hypothetical protein
MSALRVVNVYLLMAMPLIVNAEKLLVFKDGSEILVKAVERGYVDCRGRAIAKGDGVIRDTEDTCAVIRAEAVPSLPRTASRWAEQVIEGMACIAIGLYILRTWYLKPRRS